tara:strand:+ start:462 stop:896 length:435 start_codon:yes stop_codon:yes gene_type:complete
MKKVGRPKKKPQEPKDAFHNKTTGEIKTSKFFKMWHERKKPKTGQTGNIRTPEEFLDTAKRGGRAGGGKSRREHRFPHSPHMTDTDILNQLMGYIGYLQEWQKSNITGAEYKGFKKCKDRIKRFIYDRRNAQTKQPEQEGDWQI